MSVITTPDLITALTSTVTPIRRLRPPLMRAAYWLVLAALLVGLLAMSQGLRPDLFQRLHDSTFTTSVAAALLTGVLAAAAAFMVSLPDRSPAWSLLPGPALVVWLSTLGYQCLTGWVTLGPDGIGLGEAVRCFATLVLTGLPLSLAMLIMLRHAARLRPLAVSVTGSLAVAAITATALSLFHPLDATVMILTWNVGVAVLMVGLGGTLGRKLFSWIAPRSPLNGG